MLLLCVLRPKALLPRHSKLLPIFPGGRSHFSLISGPAWTLWLQFTKYQQSYAQMKIFKKIFVIPLALNCTGASLCATSYYLPRAYNAPLGAALVNMLDFHVWAGTRFSLRDKRLFEISEVKIMRVNCSSVTVFHFYSRQINTWAQMFKALLA